MEEGMDTQEKKYGITVCMVGRRTRSKVKAFKKQFYLSKLMIPDTTCTKEYEKNLSQFGGINYCS